MCEAVIIGGGGATASSLLPQGLFSMAYTCSVYTVIIGFGFEVWSRVKEVLSIPMGHVMTQEFSVSFGKNRDPVATSAFASEF